MKRKIVLNIVILLFISFVNVVYAKVNVLDNGYMVQKLASMSTPTITGVSSSNDLVTVRATGNIVGYYYGTSTSLNNASYTSTTSSNFYASVKNGIYYFWVAGAGVSTGNVNAVMYPYAVKVTTSCSNQIVKNCTSTGTFDRCFVYTGGKSVSPEQGGNLVTPAAGYKLDSVTVAKNNCSNLSLTVNGQRLARRYCKVTFQFKCSKIAVDVCQTAPNSVDCICKKDPNGASCACMKDANSADCACKKNANSADCICKKSPNSRECTCAKNPSACETPVPCPSGYVLENGKCVRKVNPDPLSPYLTALSVTPGVLSPAFSPQTRDYTVTVESNVTQVNINANSATGRAAGSINGTGTKGVSVGKNTFKISVFNTAGTVDYYVTVIRKAICNKDNTLKSLSLTEAELDPIFKAGVLSYNAKVDKEKTIGVKATINDSKSTFVDGFGPRDVKVVPGNNRIDIKVKNECGEVKIYVINVTVPQVCDPTPEKSAKLKSLELKSSKEEVEMPKIDFDPDTYNYNVDIPYEYGQLDIIAGTETEGDKIEITGLPSVLPLNKPVTVSVIVTSKKCPDVQKTYTLELTRGEKPIPNPDPSLASFNVTNHKEFQFKKSQNDYKVLKLRKGERKVTINYVPEQKTTTCYHSVFNGESMNKTAKEAEVPDKNTKLNNKVDVRLGSIITVTCVAEDGVSKQTYRVQVVSVTKKTNIFLIILIVLIIIFLLIYLVLRLLGYKIYFNFAVIGSFFRGIGEGIKNMFDR